MADILNELLEVERRGWDSLCSSSGAEFYGSVMTDDALMVLANGATMDRATVVRSLSEAPPWRTYKILDPRVVHNGIDSSILVYTGVAYNEPEEPAFTGVMSSVYVRANSTWKLALYQQTPIPNS